MTGPEAPASGGQAPRVVVPWGCLGVLALAVVAAIAAGYVRLVRPLVMPPESARLFDAAAAGAAVVGPPSYARVGDRWTFVARSKQGGGERTETWDVLEVGPTVRCRVDRGDGRPPEVVDWTLALPVGPTRVVQGWRKQRQVGGRWVPFDVLRVDDPASADLLEVWIAVDPATDRPTFPGVTWVVRLDPRGRSVSERELTGVAPVTSGT